MDSAPVKNTPETNVDQTEGEKPKTTEEHAAFEVIVKGLNYAADQNSIGIFFEEQFGDVIKVNLLRTADRRSKGLAFVTFDSEESVAKAIAGSNIEFMGRYLIIERTRPISERNVQKKETEKIEESKTIFVGNLAYKTNSDDLKNFFATCGKVVDARVATFDGKSKGFGHVEFEDKSAVEKALKLAGQDLDGRVIRVDVAGQFKKKENFRFRN